MVKNRRFVFRGNPKTGLLIEYEDTFPFEGQFEKVKGSFSFSADQINKINQLAVANNLTVIPYLSLFDDLNFVLRHPDFKKYREMPHYSEMISPLHEVEFRKNSFIFTNLTFKGYQIKQKSRL